jgi:hypothetical protein
MSIDFVTLKSLKEKHKCEIFFETGFYVGKRFGYALDAGFEKAFSIELLESFVNDGISKFSNEIAEDRAKIILDDSANIAKYLEDIKDKKILFWLDAHLDNGLGTAVTTPKEFCPLSYELQAIKDVLKVRPIILIDDLRIIKSNIDWGRGYKFDDILNKVYDIDKTYNIEYIDGTVENDILIAY